MVALARRPLADLCLARTLDRVQRVLDGGREIRFRPSELGIRGVTRLPHAPHQRLDAVDLRFAPGLGGRFVPNTPLVHTIGVIIQAAFLSFAIWARRTLGRNWSGNVTVKVDHELVRTGPYRRIRHPIYTAMFGMYAGAAIAVGEVHSLVALGILMLAYARKMRQEEIVMRGEFGSAYDDYRRHSWAVIPPIW